MPIGSKPSKPRRGPSHETRRNRNRAVRYSAMGKVVQARIDGIVAREAPVAVIFRRGPSRYTQLLTWNLETDEVTPGQWITGRVYTRRCDLSPDGKLLVASFTNYSEALARKLKRETGGWTALSRPPYFSAIGVWEGIGAYNGGGHWYGPRHLGLNLDLDADVKSAPPKWLKYDFLGLPRSENEEIFRLRLLRDGWKEAQTYELTKIPKWERTNKLRTAKAGVTWMSAEEITAHEWQDLVVQTGSTYALTRPAIWQKPFSRGVLERILGFNELWRVRDESGQIRLRLPPDETSIHFLDIDHRGRVVFGDQGCLWAWEGFPDGEPTLIADLNANRFEAIEAPAWAVSREKP